MSLVELARIASKYETNMAHAMLHACAVARLSECSFPDEPGDGK